jgi:hypothetical protein
VRRTFKVGSNLDMANVDINNRANKATGCRKPSPRESGSEEIARHPSGNFRLLAGQHFDDLSFQLHLHQSRGLIARTRRRFTMIVGQRDMHALGPPRQAGQAGLTGSTSPTW